MGAKIKIAYFLLCLCFLAQGAIAQEQQVRYSVALRNVSLNDALAQFSNQSGNGITFEPQLIKNKRVFCVIENAMAEEVLQCLLKDTGLDFVQLSSGTYVINTATQKPPLFSTLAGIVRDQQTGRPLPNAHIFLASTSDEIGIVTNRNGQFTLPPLLPGRYLINTTYIGYQDKIDTLQIEAGSHRFSRIELSEEPIVFTPIVINGLQRQRPMEKLDRSILLRSDEVKTGVTNTGIAIMHQLASLPGVHVNDLTADANLQGSDSGEHQFRLDGVPIFLPQSRIGILGPFSPFAIQSLAVHRSGFGASIGSHLAGVIEAEHVLEGQQSFDVQFDPMSLNARALINRELVGGRKFDVMVAGRSSIWQFYQQPQFQSALESWSKPDPFVIFAPSRQYTKIDASFFQDVLNLNSLPNTNLSFSDIHAAAKLSFSPFSALEGSFYRGNNQFSGSLIRDLLGVEAQYGFDQETNLFVNRVVPAPLSLVDDYEWQNDAGQLSYHTLLGHRTLLNVQARASRYALNQQYRILDGLAEFIASLPTPDDAGIPTMEGGTISEEIPPTELTDSNTIEEYAIEGMLEHAIGQHFLIAGLESTYNESHFNLLLPSLNPTSISFTDSLTQSDVEMARIEYPAVASRHTIFGEDRISIGDHMAVEIGTRLTYIPVRKTVYAEPRISIRFDGALGASGAFALQTAGGVYRQYLLQFDISTLNAGALFPSKRVWLPVNDQIRPPLAYHISQSVLLEPSDQFAFKLEGYAKIQQLGWALTYIESDDSATRLAVNEINSIQFPEFLSPTKGEILGISANIKWHTDRLYLNANYDFSSTRRQSAALFNNRSTTVPWSEPHRLTTSAEWLPINGLVLSARFSGIWGRTWGFRQAYYDFFGHNTATSYQPPYDFSRPGDHVLPPLYQLDLGIAYSQPVKSGDVQIRLDLLNALNRANVIDWRLVWREDALAKEARHLYGRIPSLSLRFSF